MKADAANGSEEVANALAVISACPIVDLVQPVEHGHGAKGVRVKMTNGKR